MYNNTRQQNIVKSIKKGLSQPSWWVVFLAVFIFNFSRYYHRFHLWIESVYSVGINQKILISLSRITALIPFSIAEILYFIFWILIIIGSIYGLYVLVRYKKGYVIKKIVVTISSLYILFMFLWGFNYYRTPISQTLQMSQSSYTVEQLQNSVRILIERANTLRQQVQVDKYGVMTINDDLSSVIKRAQLGYDALDSRFELLKGTYGLPKTFVFSDAWLYMGITGMYFPFTAEANVNAHAPHILLPFVILHEMAHQRGIAYEDEANFVAFLTAIAHPDVDFQYSGTMISLIYTINALHRMDPKAAFELRQLYSNDVRRDFVFYRNFWNLYQGKIQDISDSINDIYLKGNQQTDGVQSYSRMVALVIAYFEDQSE